VRVDDHFVKIMCSWRGCDVIWHWLCVFLRFLLSCLSLYVCVWLSSAFIANETCSYYIIACIITCTLFSFSTRLSNVLPRFTPNFSIVPACANMVDLWLTNNVCTAAHQWRAMELGGPSPQFLPKLPRFFHVVSS